MASLLSSLTRALRGSDAPDSAISQLKPRMVVIGVGGAGGNAVNNMVRARLRGVKFVSADTDAQALDQSLSTVRIQLGRATTEGLGSGAKPDIGSAAAEEVAQEIVDQVEGNHIVFITAGMGGGTGTGAAPVIARLVREAGTLSVGVVTKPFEFEGRRRMNTALEGVTALADVVDTLIVIPNQSLFRTASERTTLVEAFQMADDVLYSGVVGLTEMMIHPGHVNLDFADIRTVMTAMGQAVMGIGEASGPGRAADAANSAISNPLLSHISLKSARRIVVNIAGGYETTLNEINDAISVIRSVTDPEANLIFGSSFTDGLEGRLRITLFAAGIPQGGAKKQTAEADSENTTALKRSTAKARKRPAAKQATAELAIAASEEPSAESAPPTAGKRSKRRAKTERKPASFAKIVSGEVGGNAQEKSAEPIDKTADEIKQVAEAAARRADEEARRKVEAEASEAARRAKLKAEEDASYAAEEARRKAEARTKLAAEEAQRGIERAARRAAQIAKRKTEEEARQAAEEARQKAEARAMAVTLEIRRKAEADARRAAREVRRKAEKEANALAEETMHKAEEEARRIAEEAKREAEAEAAQTMEQAKRKAVATARRLATESKRKANAAAEATRREAEEEANRIAEEAKSRAEAEAQRMAEEARKKAEKEAKLAAEAVKRAADEEARRAATEARRRTEDRARRAAAEARRKAEEEAAKLAEKIKREADAAAKKAAIATRRKAEENAQRITREARETAQADAQRITEESRNAATAEAKQIAEETKRDAVAEAEQIATETKRKAELIAQQIAEETRRRAQAEAQEVTAAAERLAITLTKRSSSGHWRVTGIAATILLPLLAGGAWYMQEHEPARWSSLIAAAKRAIPDLAPESGGTSGMGSASTEALGDDGATRLSVQGLSPESQDRIDKLKAEEARQAAEAAKLRAEEERLEAIAAKLRAEEERLKADEAARLRAVEAIKLEAEKERLQAETARRKAEEDRLKAQEAAREQAIAADKLRLEQERLKSETVKLEAAEPQTPGLGTPPIQALDAAKSGGAVASPLPATNAAPSETEKLNELLVEERRRKADGW